MSRLVVGFVLGAMGSCMLHRQAHVPFLEPSAVNVSMDAGQPEAVLVFPPFDVTETQAMGARWGDGPDAGAQTLRTDGLPDAQAGDVIRADAGLGAATAMVPADLPEAQAVDTHWADAGSDGGLRASDVERASPAVRIDGRMLQAIRVAADDFLPRDIKFPPGTPLVDRCFHTQAAQDYIVIQRGEIFFVKIELRHERCGAKIGMLDSGGRYAIDKEGRILRRVLDGEPE